MNKKRLKQYKIKSSCKQMEKIRNKQTKQTVLIYYFLFILYHIVSDRLCNTYIEELRK